MAEAIPQTTPVSQHGHSQTTQIHYLGGLTPSSHTQKSTSSEADRFYRDFQQFNNSIYHKQYTKPYNNDAKQVAKTGGFGSEVGSRSLEEEIKVLNKKLKKKDDLIHYLQRKCGNQIIKSTGALYNRIYQLEQQNKKLLETCVTSSPAYQSIKAHEKRTPHLLHTLNEQQLHSIILTQASEIEKLFKKLQMKQSNRRNREVKLMDENCDINSTENVLINSINSNGTFSSASISEDNLHTLEQVNSSFHSDKRATHGYRRSSIQIPTVKKKTKPHTHDCRQKSEQGVQSEEIQRASESVQTQEDWKFAQIQRENLQVQQKNRRLQEQLLEVREQLNFFREKIQTCYDNLDYNIQEAMDLSPCKSGTPEKDFSASKDMTSSMRDSMREYYMQIVETIGIEVSQLATANQIHQIILQQIEAIKKQTRKMVKEFSKLERQLIKLEEQKYSVEEQLIQEQRHNEGMNKFIESLCIELDTANQLLMNSKLVYLQLKYKDRPDDSREGIEPESDLRVNIQIQQ